MGYIEFLAKKAEEGYKVNIVETMIAIEKICSEVPNFIGSSEIIDFLSTACAIGMEETGISTNKIDEQWREMYISKECDRELVKEIIQQAWNKETKKFDLHCSEKAEQVFKKLKKDAEKKDSEASEKEKIAEYLNTPWIKGMVEANVSNMVRLLSALYKSGIESMPQIGVLADCGDGKSPLVKIKNNEKDATQFVIDSEIDSGYNYDCGIMSVLKDAVSGLGVYKAPNPETGFPNYAALTSGPVVLLEAHLMFQSVNVVVSGRGNNKNSIRKWITATKDVSNANDWLKGATKLTNMKEVCSWYTWVLTNTVCRYMVEAGVTTESTTSNREMIKEILNNLYRSLKNVAVVTERNCDKKGEKMQTTEIKIATDNPNVDVNAIAAGIERELNMGNARDIVVSGSTITSDESGNNIDIKLLRIVYDKKEANKATKFASEIVDNLLASGNIPTWDHVLLGRTEAGDFKFWDNFMGPNRGNTAPAAADAAYAIYAGSGGGKGNMTMTLLAAALADRKKIFFVDGKPDSGMALGNEAWSKGKEAFVFDGKPSGEGDFGGQMEIHPVLNGMRTAEEPFMSSSTGVIPNGIFNNDNEVKTFLGVCRYLRCIELWLKIVKERANSNATLGDDWQVWIFDEMTSMSEKEVTIREKMAEYINKVAPKAAIKVKDKNAKEALVGFKACKELDEAEANDPCVHYIHDWINWTSELTSSLLTDLITIGLRMSHTNVIFIFQNASWLAPANAEKPGNGDVSTLAKVVLTIPTKKFVGRNALAYKCGAYGDGTTVKEAWYTDKVNTEGGWWAVSKTDRVQDGVDIFKPYSLYGMRKAGDTKTEDYKFFNYYLNRLLAGRTPAADTLQSSWDAAEASVKEIGLGASLKEFIYNVAKFSSGADSNFDTASVGGDDDAETGVPKLGAFEIAQEENWRNNDSEKNQLEESAFESSHNTDTFFEDELKSDYSTGNSIEDALVEMEADISNMENEIEVQAEAVYTESPGNTIDDALNQMNADLAEEEEAFYNEGTFGGSDSKQLGDSNTEEDDDEADRVSIVTDGDGVIVRASKEEATKETPNGTKVNLKNVERSVPVAKLDNNNRIVARSTYITSRKQLEKIMNSEKKYNRMLQFTFDGILKDISTSVGGRMSVYTITIFTNKITVNESKLVTSPMFGLMGPEPMVELIDFGELLAKFANLKVLRLDRTMFNVFETQIEAAITEKDINNGITEAAYYVLKHRQKLNTIDVDGVATFKKADLLNKEREENMRIKKERAAAKTEKALGERLNTIKKAKKMKVSASRKVSGKSTAKKILGIGGGIVALPFKLAGGIIKVAYKLSGIF